MEEKEKKPRFSVKNYKRLLILPIVVLLLSSIYILTTPTDLDIDFKGGSQITFDSSSYIDANSLTSLLSGYEAKIRTGRSVSGWSAIITFDSSVNSTEIISSLETAGYDLSDHSLQTIGPALGASFFSQAKTALIIAFILMAITVFIIFRKPLPSFYVVLCASSDIICTFAISQILGIKLSLATFAALLLLVGYSVDTDILLTTRVMKTTEGEVRERIRKAMKTGLTMSATSASAFLALYLMSSSTVITQIASILMIGLLLDVMFTWTLNAPLIRSYLERKK
jgi:preprotein translocase subunit SecF